MCCIAHLSDLHFSHYSCTLSPKKLLGNLNLFFHRKRQYPTERPFSLIKTLKQKQVTHVIISGDLTATSYKQEYAVAKAFIEQLQRIGMQVFLVPGNHDHYTSQDYKSKIFYHYFPSHYTSPSSKMCTFTLRNHGVTSITLIQGWRLVLLDTTVSTSLFSSVGLFSLDVEKNLKSLLAYIEKDEKVLLVNHFPFFQHGQRRHRLLRGKFLQNLICNNPHISLYLHGHTHHHTISDLRSHNLPLILDSGSTGHTSGSWNLMQLNNTTLDLTVYRWRKDWSPIHTQSFQFAL